MSNAPAAPGPFAITRFGVAALAVSLLTLAAAPASAQFAFTTLDHPLAGPGGTAAYDISGDRVVGTYFDAANASHGFIYDGVTWTTLDHPGAAAPRGTTAFGVSGNRITGTFVDPSGQTFGYLFDGVTFSTIARPPVGGGTADTFTRGVSGDTVVGYSIQGQTARGFVYIGGIITDLPVPGAEATFPDDVDGGRIVGTFDDPLGMHGFVSEGGVTRVLDHPEGTLLGTFVTGVSGPNIVGTYLRFPDATAHGFLYDGTRFIPIDVPGATDTNVNGIEGLRVVGSYTDVTGRTHGFVMTVPEPSLMAVPLVCLWLSSRTVWRGRSRAAERAGRRRVRGRSIASGRPAVRPAGRVAGRRVGSSAPPTAASSA